MVTLLPDQLFREPVTGPSYGQGTKLILVAVLAQMVWLAFSTAATWSQVTWQMWLFIGLALIPILAWSWTILTGLTTIDAKGIRRQVPFNQSGYNLRWHEIAGVRYVGLPIFARLVVKTSAPGAAKAFHVGNRQMKEAFLRLEKAYRFQIS